MIFHNQAILVRKPFVIGSSNSLFNSESLARLRSELMNFYTVKDNLEEAKFSKYRVNSIDQKDVFSQFVDSLEADEQEIFNTLLGFELRERILKGFWKEIILNRLDRYCIDVFLFRFFNIDAFETRIELSFMPKGSRIVPHTDALGKVISGLIYLDDGSGRDEHLGIEFWNYDNKNQKNSHYNDTSQRETFYSDAEPLYKPDFSSSRFYWFFRNKRSWHTVEPVDNVPEDYVRISVNYNIMVTRSLYGRLKKLFRRK